MDRIRTFPRSDPDWLGLLTGQCNHNCALGDWFNYHRPGGWRWSPCAPPYMLWQRWTRLSPAAGSVLEPCRPVQCWKARQPVRAPPCTARFHSFRLTQLEHSPTGQFPSPSPFAPPTRTASVTQPNIRKSTYTTLKHNYCAGDRLMHCLGYNCTVHRTVKKMKECQV